MYPIDPRTVILLSGIMGGLMAVVLFALRRSYPATIQGLNEWATACLVLFVAGVLSAARGFAPDLVAVVLPNLLITFGTYWLSVGTQRFFGIRPALRRHLLMLAAANLLALWFHSVEPSYRMRLVVIVPVLAYMFGHHALVMVRHRQPRFAYWFLIVVLGLATLSQLLRLYSTLTRPVGDGLFDPAIENMVYIVVYPFLVLLVAIGLVLLATDRLRTELEYLSTHDALTNALSRRQMNEVCSLELERCRRHGLELSLLAMDLDHFKSVNDRFGHQMGDTVLVRFVENVRAQLRLADQVARYGGEEFIVVLPETGAAEAFQVADRIRAVCANSEQEPVCTVSIGLVTSQGDGETVDQLMARADAAMYRAKVGGRNQVQVHTWSEIAAVNTS